MTLFQLQSDLSKLKNPRQAAILQRFFKTGKGEYGQGDIFYGIKVPEVRKLVRQYYKDISLEDDIKLLHSKIHEERLCAVLILVAKFEKADEKEKGEIYTIYLKNAKYVNNWDLVDLSAPNIVGNYLLVKDRKILYKLAKSKNLWEKRISILSTYTFIRESQFEDTIKISEIFLKDDHDLIHKAVGWMLREVGKRDQAVEEKFLKKYYKTMPRTMLRYAIEKFPENKRKFYLKK
ncbi:DNA alkylation repair protein [Patescibacteria group bacterium]|nr:DNA alkylation repair protein [Patescibacteria group bacterium]MBU1673812.1 DNA alkylation repair protein [Patescibacteria group bacterium]MBU1964059.1 DNA alkylation repair protein [Patescibacteria group bacterium]